MDFARRVYGILNRGQCETTLEDAFWFCCLALFFGLAFYAALSAGSFLQEAAAHSAIPMLEGLGVDAHVELAGVPRLVGGVDGRPFSADITPLCGGALELAVLWGFVMASRDRSLRDRLEGIAFGAIVLMAFNPLRIAVTLRLYGTPSFELAHDTLFRLMLVAVLIGAYAAWYIPKRHK